MTIRLINPADLPPQATYTQVVVAAGTTWCSSPARNLRTSTATPSPQATWRARPARYTRIWAARSPRQAPALTRLPGSPSNVVGYKSEYLPVIEQARVELFGDHKPADTLIGAARLARPEFLIEVDAIAVK